MAKTLTERLAEKKALKKQIAEHENGYKLNKRERNAVAARIMKKAKKGK